MTWSTMLAAFVWGCRHGVDWDHLAAIGDLTASAGSRTRGVVQASWYAVGHAAVLTAFGVAAIGFGATLPHAVDAVFGRVVGLTLVLLGAWMLWSLSTSGPRFRIRSRWALLAAWRSPAPEEIVVVHDHEHDHRRRGHAHLHAALATSRSQPPPNGLDAVHGHVHEHREVLPAASPSRRATVGIGMLHGVGAETPTQVLILAAASGAASTINGFMFLGSFVMGLFAANTGLALAAAGGLIDPQGRPATYRVLGALVASSSIIVGAVMVMGADHILPGLIA